MLQNREDQNSTHKLEVIKLSAKTPVYTPKASANYYNFKACD